MGLALTSFLVGLLAIANPLGAIPVYLSLCAGKDPLVCQRVPRITALAFFLILAAALLIGDTLLRLFGITIDAFRVGGGLLILLMAISMLKAKPTSLKARPEETEEAQNSDTFAVVPLAMPMLAGPGAISLVIIQANNTHQPLELGLYLLVIAVVAVLLWLTLKLAQPLGELLGITGLNVFTRIMGLILTAIGVQMMADGLRTLLPGLAG